MNSILHMMPLFCLFTITLVSADGTLDTSFGTGGLTSLRYVNGFSTANAKVNTWCV